MQPPVRAKPRRRGSGKRLRLIAFIAMVFGMFMAILDIQIVSASLSEIQAGLSASSEEVAWVQTAYLIAEVVMIPLSGILSRAFSTRYFFAAVLRRLHGDELHVLDRHRHQPDDRVARAAGFHRGRHDPHRLRGRVHDFPPREAARSSRR